MTTAEKVGTALVERPTKVSELTTPVSSISGPVAVMPRSFGELLQFADLMSRCNFVPAHLRNKPGDCMAVVMQAMRWEADPFMVAQKTYFVKDGGPPGYEAQLIAAIINSRAPIVGRPDIAWSGEWPNRRCTVSAVFQGESKPKAREVKAETITTRNSPLWKADPDQQLAYYTLRAWARLYCPDVIMGIYTKDEVVEIQANDERDIAGRATAADVQTMITGGATETKPAEQDQGKPATTTEVKTESEAAAQQHDAQASEQGGSAAKNGAPDAQKEQAETAVPTLAFPPENATPKAWSNWRGQMLEQIKRAPSRTWLAELEVANKDGMAVLERDFPQSHQMLRKAISERAAEMAEAA